MSFRMIILSLMLSLVLGAGSACAQHAGHSGAKQTVRKPAAGLAMGAAFAPTGELWVSGLDEQARLFVQSSADAGATWGPRRVLDTQGDPISADGETWPKIAFGPNGWVVLTYTKPLAKPYTGDIRMLRSEDGGRTFSLPFTVHDDRQVITHRFESTAFDSKGSLHVVWVDKRDAELARAREGGKRAAYDGAAIYGKVSKDGGRSFGPDLMLAEHSCECCRIALVESPQSGLVAMWRHVFPNSVRDHAFVPLSALGKGQAPVRASIDEWVLGACPHHGPGMANAATGGYHAVWFGMRDGKAAVRYGRLGSEGHPVGRSRDLPDARAEHADVAARGRNVAVVWRSFDGQQTRVRAWLSSDDGKSFAARELMTSAQDNDHPRLVARDADNYVVWRTEREINVQKIVW